MSYLLEILGRGLLAELGAAFREFLDEPDTTSLLELEARASRDPSSCDAHHRLGVRLLKERQFRSAQEAFQKAITQSPADRKSRLGLTCALDEMGRTHDAASELRLALEQESDAPTWFALGFCLEKLGETSEAQEAYENALDIAPRLRNAHERLAAIHLKLNQTDEAIEHYEYLCACEPEQLSVGLALANLYLRAARHDDAIRQFENVIALEPDNWEAQDDLVRACVEAERYDDAVRILRELIDQRPECADQHVQLGDLYTKLGRADQSADAYERAVALDPDYLEAAVKMGAARLRQGQFRKAAGDFNRAIEINDRILSAYVGLGVAQQAAGQHDDARATLEMAAEIEPNGTLLFGETARLQLSVTAAEQAKRYLSPRATAALPAGPLPPEVTSFVQQQISNLRTAIQTHGDHADLHYRLGVLLRHENDLAGATDSFRRAVTINPQYFKALTKLGLALKAAGRSNEAIACFRQALQVDSESVDLHYQLGLLFSDRNEFTLALERFEVAAAKEPGNRNYLAHIALALQNMGLVDRAEATWRALCEVADPSATTSSRT